MIKMPETKGLDVSANYTSAESFKEIKPATEQTKEAAMVFWDKFFSGEPEDSERSGKEWRDLTWDEIPTLIFGIDEWDFDFGKVDNAKIKDVIQRVYSEWIEEDFDKRETDVKDLTEAICEYLGLKKIPDISFIDAGKEDCGAFNAENGKIEINRNILDDPKELINTLAHELRHAYQWEHSLDPKSLEDYLYKCNFEAYISPVPIGNGKYLFIIDYMEQYIEAEARAFARAFDNLEVA